MTLAINHDGQLFRSDDGGEWTLLDFTLRNSLGFRPRLAFVGGRFFSYSRLETYSSADGSQWRRVPNESRDVVWTGETYVGVASRGWVTRSSDGISWTSSLIPDFSGDLLSAAWTGSEIVAVGSDGAAFSSPDGMSWSPLASGITADLVEAVWDGTQVVARAANGDLVFFSEGPALPANFSPYSLAVHDGRLMVAGYAGGIAQLGESGWEVTDTGLEGLLHLAPTPTGWLLSGNGTGLLRGSADPVPVWDLISRPVPYPEFPKLAAYGSSTFVSVGLRGHVATSTDGRIWNSWGRPVSDALHAGLLIENGDFVGVGAGGAIARLAPGGAVSLPRSPTRVDLHAIARSGERLVAVGDGGVILLSKSGSEAPLRYESWIAGELGADGDDQGDTNGDGIPNLIAYLHGIPAGSPPSTTERRRLPHMETATGNGLSFEIELRDDLEVRILRSFDCVGWTEVARKIGTGSWGGVAAVTEEAAGSGRVMCRLSEPALSEGLPRVFYRLESSLR